VITAPKPERTLTLEPVERSASVGELADLLATPSYAAAEELDEAKTHAEDPLRRGEPLPKRSGDALQRVTNVSDQLALQIEAIDLPAMPLASFVEMLAEMAAVPIALDAATLEAAGVSPRTKITVRARGETIASLLTKALAKHGLAWEEREGQLVIVRDRKATTGDVAPAAGR
jgi:hypothetical protein